MATQIVVRGQHVAPSAYKITGLNPFTPSVATAQWDGSGASGDFFPCMSFYSQDGQLLARMGVEAAVTAGDSAQVTYGPFLRQAGGGDGIKYDVENVGGYLHVEADDGTHGLGNIVFYAPDGEFLVTTNNTPGVGEIDLNSAQISLRGSNGLFQVNDDGSAMWSGDAGLSVRFDGVDLESASAFDISTDSNAQISLTSDGKLIMATSGASKPIRLIAGAANISAELADSQTFFVERTSTGTDFPFTVQGDGSVSRFNLKAGGTVQIRDHSLNELVEFQEGGDVLMPHLPTSAPVTPGALWNDGGTVKIV